MADRLLKQLDDVDRRNFMANMARACLGVSVLPAIQTASPMVAWAQEAAKKARAKQVIYLYMSGGMTHIDTFDPKPKNSDVQGPLKPLQTKVPGILIGEHLPKLAQLMDKITIVRSMNTNQGAHGPGSYLAHTSYAPRATIRHPAMGAWAMNFLGKINPDIPGNVVIAGSSNHPGAGFMELKHGPLPIGDPRVGIPNAKLLRGVDEREFYSRLSLVAKFGEAFLKRYPQKKVKGYGEMYVDAIRLMKSEDLKAFNINEEDQESKDRFGADRFGQACLLARRLIERGVRFIEVGHGGWDTHNENFDAMATRLPILDQALSSLITDLESRGLLKTTLIVLTSEFGRSPKINERNGRDHHPAAYSSLLIGGGVKGGHVHGSSDEDAHYVDTDEMFVANFNATIAYAMGMPIKKIVYSGTRRPFRVADEGEPVMSIFA